MRNHLLRYPLALLVLSSCADSSAPESASTETMSANGSRILRSETGRLTGTSLEDARSIAKDFLLLNTDISSGDELVVVSEYTSASGVTHVRFEQRVDGLRVAGAYARVAISDLGEVIQSIDKLVSGADYVRSARIGSQDALLVAMNNLGFSGRPALKSQAGSMSTFEKLPAFFKAPTVERVAYADQDGNLSAGFMVETWSGRENELNHTLVSGSGKILNVELRTNNDSYNVFVEDPSKGPQAVVNGPAAGTNPNSPNGWLGSGSQTTNNISGNNANAYLDTDANNGPDNTGTAVTNGNFLQAADLSAQPSTTGNRAVAVQNLFFLNNVIHDVLYSHGFNEANLNFQVNNFGKGGAGNDPVLAEAQDGSGTDNANFSTPSDGSSPRMQMYLWTGGGPNALVTVGGATYSAWSSSFGPAMTTAGTAANLAIYNDGTGVTSDGCEAATVSLTGKMALVDRGTCDFTVKVLNAQKAGAKGVIIVNNVSPGAFNPGGTNARIKIPSAMVTQSDGGIIRTLVAQSTNLKKNPTPVLQIDGDIDSDVVFHEYGHGLTWRMIGSMSGALAGAIGEGASDVVAFTQNGDDRIGEYAYSNANGIRRYPYDGYPLTYSAVTGAEVHNDGEIYAGAMYRVLKNYLAAGLTAQDLMFNFVDGMNYTPATPAFEDMRDGMLQSAAGSGRECLIWKGFAASGIGVGADGSVSATGKVTIVESFTLPSSCP